VDALTTENLDGVVEVSSAMREHHRLRMLGVRPVVIHSGMPLLDFEPGIFPRQCLKLAKSCENKFKIIFVGRLSPEKRVNNYQISHGSISKNCYPTIDFPHSRRREAEGEKKVWVIQNLALHDRTFLFDEPC
jgi:hypothetical protein